jgi:hypothetical protein
MRRITFFAIAMTMLCSCATRKSVEYVDREVVKYQKEVVHDTLIQHTHDSVYHTIFQKGDTVYDTKYVERTRWRDKVVVKKDTCWRDSIVTIKKETVKEVTKIPKLFKIAFVFSILVIIFAIVKLLRWLQIIH